MNERIINLAKQAGYQEDLFGFGHWDMPEFKEFVRLFKVALIDELRNQIVDAESELDIEDRCYLRGNNGGITDAMIIIQNFGEVIEE